MSLDPPPPQVADLGRKTPTAGRDEERAAAAVDAIVKRGLFVEVNGGELEHIATVYTPEGQALIILDALSRAGFVVTKAVAP